MKTVRNNHVQSAQSRSPSGAPMSSLRSHEDCQELHVTCPFCAIMKTVRNYQVQSAQS
ncbi:hypothetical protein DPMN_169482 [Dreissena polymorpha]|uniref:Uncharacterized protein n=1 Tax=Dreissena polymorpha TaxID=45954 RepID=A0A9D4DXG3_DREPO|nr:hypothetical protein DPMN_169482 [Dreissena polymorpha]